MTDHLVKFRRELHKHPELSHQEKGTAERLIKYITPLKPDKLITNLGGYGLAAIFRGANAGPSILLRCDMDALPIEESNPVNYKSIHPGISHKCGHDGHMAIMLGMAEILSKKSFPNGEVILLFQPAEEQGEGARQVLEDKKFRQFNPDYTFALHNLPGYPKGSLVIKNGFFSTASEGLEIKLYGKTSHAGEPENGINPAKAVSGIIEKLLRIHQDFRFETRTFITIVHVNLGEIAYGTSAGYAEIRCTLRSYDNKDLKTLKSRTLKIIKKIAKMEGLTCKVAWHEFFPATVNHPKSVKIVECSAWKANLGIIQLSEPLPWSEDFAHFLLQSPGCLFGLGAGPKQSQLHHPDYDFPDEIIPAGIALFRGIIREIMAADL